MDLDTVLAVLEYPFTNFEPFFYPTDSHSSSFSVTWYCARTLVCMVALVRSVCFVRIV